MAETTTIAALVDRVRAFRAALSAGVKTNWGEDTEAQFYADGDTAAGETLESDPPPVRDKADLVAAISYVVEDKGFVQDAHVGILNRALEYLAKPAPRVVPDMSGDLSQIKALADMANDLASGLDQRGMGDRARAEMHQLIALPAAMHAFASRSYDVCERGEA